MDPRPVKKDMLVGLVDLRVAREDLDLEAARRVADQSAREKLENPMLLAWFDKNSWTHSPAIC